EYYYFHNCLYEGVWRDNRRRWDAQTPTAEVLRTYGGDYKAIFVGDAAMSPYEIAHPGGANDHWNPEAGDVGLRRAWAKRPGHVWLTPRPERHWIHPRADGMIRRHFEGRMFPLTLDGIARAMKALTRGAWTSPRAAARVPAFADGRAMTTIDQTPAP